MHENQETQVMQFNGNEVTFLKIENDYWTPAVDIARAIGHTSPRSTVRDIFSKSPALFEGYTLSASLSHAGQAREYTLLNRDGLVAFCLKSNHENAIPFQKWAVSKISELMSKGITTLDSRPVSKDSITVLLRHAADEIEKRDVVIEILTPKAEAYDDFIGSDTITSVREVAQLLAIPNMGQNNLFKYMRQIHMVDIENMPYQNHVDSLRLKRIPNGFKPDGSAAYKTVFLTKGIDYIRKRLIADGYIKNTQPTVKHCLTVETSSQHE